MTVKYRIHPAIGIARVGDSLDDYFIGPEAPGILPILNKPDGSSLRPGKYKDPQQRIKRQGARFRIYAYTEDPAGVVTKVSEITDADAEIEWEVHLANRKAVASKLQGSGRRNSQLPESDLVVDAGPQRIKGANQAMKPLRATFMKKFAVELGDLLTDSGGRLIVLGGHGRTHSLPNTPLKHFADNDGWCDDTADGPVRATLRLKGSAAAIVAEPSWLIVAPPDFAPPIDNVVTLYDAVYNVMTHFDPRLAVTAATTVSFTRDIYPILRRVCQLQWVSAVAASMHGTGAPHCFMAQVAQLSSNGQDDATRNARGRIVRALRSPKTGVGSMPKLPAEAVKKAPGATLTETQYARMERWAQGAFVADWPGAEPPPVPFDQLPENERPEALDRAALEACVGGPFFPGIEASRLMIEPATYDVSRQFRIDSRLRAGTLTGPMAVPWQADFHDCSIQEGADWWPGQRPNEVRRGQEQAADWVPPDWNKDGPEEHLDMVNKWSQLGFVVAQSKGDAVEYVEDERSLTPAAPD